MNASEFVVECTWEHSLFLTLSLSLSLSLLKHKNMKIVNHARATSPGNSVCSNLHSFSRLTFTKNGKFLILAAFLALEKSHSIRVKLGVNNKKHFQKFELKTKLKFRPAPQSQHAMPKIAEKLAHVMAKSDRKFAFSMKLNRNFADVQDVDAFFW
jgi:hypothetical protein